MTLSKTLVGSLTLLLGALITPYSYSAAPPALSNPVVGAPSTDPVYLGSMQGNATVSAGGNASYVIPLELPPGTRGMAPNLSFNYNSNMKNGLLGLGWFIQGASSTITRCPQNLSQDGQIEAIDYSATDRFCMDGHRLLVTNSGTYGDSGTVYRTEHDNFSRVESTGTAGSGPEQFEVRSKGGLIKTYGATSDSRIESEGESTVRVWALSKVEDQTGNYYTITYYENNTLGQYYPTQIDYTANDIAGVSAQASVEFIYESRTDTTVQYEMDSKIARHPKRMTNVKAYSDLNLVSDYRLTYEEIGVDSRSRITEIKRCDGAGLCQDPLSMEWWDDSVLSYSNRTLTVPYYLASSSTYGSLAAKIGQYGVPRWHDMNGDGAPDYVHIVPNSNGSYSSTSLDFEIMMSGPTGYSTVTWNTTLAGDPRKFTWADMNGDGRTDIFIEQGSGASSTLTVALSTPIGFDTQTWTGPESGYLKQTLFRDMNGDGLPDGITVVTAIPSYKREVWVNLNTGTDLGTKQVWRTNLPGTVAIRDMNGDGMADVLNSVYFNGYSSLQVYFSHGTGIETTLGFSHYQYNPTYPFGNYNGDGLTDRLAPNANGFSVSMINTGSTFHEAALSSRAPIINLDDNVYGDSYSVVNLTWWGVSTTVNAYLAKDDHGASYQTVNLPMPSGLLDKHHQWSDIDGDGFSDFSIAKTFVCKTSGSTSYYCEDGDLQISTNDGELPHLLKSVSNGLGTKIEFTYKPLTDHSIYTKGTSAVFPERDVQDSRHVVTHIERSDGIGGVFETNYTYEGLKQDTHGRGQLGFAKITAKDLDRGMTTMTEYAQAFPYASHPTMTEVRRTSDNRLLSSTDTTYSVHGTIGSGPVFPYVDNRVSKAFDLGDGRLLSTSTTINHCDNYGNITDTTTETVDHENKQTFKSQTLATYTSDASSTWRIAQLDSQTVKGWLNGSYNSALDRTTTHTYDASTGQRANSTRQPGGGTGIELTTTLVRDTHGNVTSETVIGPGITSRTSAIAYDTQGLFPLTLTNALGHAATQTWNADFGTKATQTDINGKTTSWTYNTFGQQALETRPDGTTTSTTAHEYSGANPDDAFYVETIVTGSRPARTYHDMLSRKLRAQSQSFTGATVNQVTEYDSQGRAYRTSEPYFTSDPVAWNTNSYDDISRVTAFTASDPSQSSTTNHDGFSVSVTDALSRTSTKWLNAAAQVIQVDDKPGTTMSITYDPVGNRTQVTNAQGTALQNSVTYTYDRLGRMLTQNDPDHGISTYTYNALGQKLSDISPKMAAASQSLTFQYDLLGRMTSRAEPEGAATWTYDDTTGGNLGKGQLHSESQSGFNKTYSYNASNYGRLTGASTVIGSSTYTNSSTYDAQGRVASLTYPGGFIVEQTYNALGYLERVQQPGGSAVYYQMLATDAAGRMTSEWKGDGSLISQSYEGSSSRITDQHTQNGATDIQHLTYGYDSAGNMTSRGDLVNTLSESFTFDNLDRLTSAQVAGATEVNYDFDETGNITQKSDMGDPFLYTTSKVHAVTQITVGATTKNLSYDNNGNLSNGDDLPTVTWSSYNKPTKLVKGSITYDFKYGPNRKRYQKDHSGNTTHYVGGSFEKISLSTSAEERHVVTANGQAIMVRKTYNGISPSHFYVHRDHIGSVTALTLETTGAVVERYSYDAWGLRRGATDWTSIMTGTTYGLRGYTGHEHLDDIGVIHMNGRVYSPKLGKMLSPDPVTQAPENGQNYNRYTYAFNNPLKYTDPSGFEVVLEEVHVTAPRVPNITFIPGWSFGKSDSEQFYQDIGGASQFYDFGDIGYLIELANMLREAYGEEPYVIADEVKEAAGDTETEDGPVAPGPIVDDRGGIDCATEGCVAAELNPGIEPRTDEHGVPELPLYPFGYFHEEGFNLQCYYDCMDRGAALHEDNLPTGAGAVTPESEAFIEIVCGLTGYVCDFDWGNF